MKNSNVKVYYNPYKADEAVLLPGPKIINIVLIVFGLIAFIWLIRLAKKQHKA